MDIHKCADSDNYILVVTRQELEALAVLNCHTPKQDLEALNVAKGKNYKIQALTSEDFIGGSSLYRSLAALTKSLR